MIRTKSIFFLFFSVMLLLTAVFSTAQDLPPAGVPPVGVPPVGGTGMKPRVAVLPLEMSDPDNIQLQVISERVAETSQLVLKSLNDYELIKAPSIPPAAFDNKTLLDWCLNESIDNLVYGKTYIGSGNTFIIEMSVFLIEKEETTVTRIEKADTALDIFDATDRITFSLIEGFSGRHIAFGKIRLNLTDVTGSFIPYIDGVEYPENTLEFSNLLIGERKLEIAQERMLESSTVFSSVIEIKDKVETVVDLPIPYFLPEEVVTLNEYEKIIEDNKDKKRFRQKVIDAYESLDTLLEYTDYNPGLADLRERYRTERADWERALAEAPVKEKREIIVGIKGGVTAGFLNDMDRDDYNETNPVPIFSEEANDQTEFGPLGGVNLQLQLAGSLYLQLEYNWTEMVFYEDELGNRTILKFEEIPILLKYMLKTGAGRFSLLMGFSFIQIKEREGFFQFIEEDTVSFPYLEYSDPAFGATFGLEYSYKIGRHILSAEARFLSSKILSYGFYDSINDNYSDGDLGIESASFSLGYGYNLGGSGEITTEENKNKWLFPAAGGLMFDTGSDENNTNIIVTGGALYGVTDSFYAGFTGFGVSGNEQIIGGMLSLAWAENPDRFINNFSFIVMPMKDEIIAAASYNIGINRWLIGALGGGSLKRLEHFSIGFLVGYYF